MVNAPSYFEIQPPGMPPVVWWVGAEVLITVFKTRPKLTTFQPSSLVSKVLLIFWVKRVVVNRLMTAVMSHFFIMFAWFQLSLRFGF
jgi:undecaprenyl pyrophosphate phosphatase UppP